MEYQIEQQLTPVLEEHLGATPATELPQAFLCGVIDFTIAPCDNDVSLHGITCCVRIDEMQHACLLRSARHDAAHTPR